VAPKDQEFEDGLSLNDSAVSRSPDPILARNARANASSAYAKIGRGLVGLIRLGSGTHALALADQAVVSSASLLTTIILGRFTHPNELGLYAIGASLMVLALNLQESLVSLPYTIQRHRVLGMPTEYAGCSLAQSGALSTFSCVLLAAAALGLSTRRAESELTAMVWVLAGATPFALLREFARKFAFAHLRLAQALIIDVTVAAIQLGVLSWLGWTGRMSAATACAALGGSCALTGIVWLFVARNNFAIRVGDLPTMTKQSWRLGKWLFASQMTVTVQSYVSYWLLAAVLDTTATGVYAACMTVAMFANPLIIGLSNVLMPGAVLAFKEGGCVQLRRQAIRDLILLGALMALFCAAVLLMGEDIMRILYRGEQYEGQGRTISVLAAASLAFAMGIPASIALTSMERPRAIVLAGLAGAIVTVVVGWWLMVEWGSLGAAYGFLWGNLIGTIGRWAIFSSLVRRRPP
jgi:O-antigen/teichoic acid export membrane protein